MPVCATGKRTPGEAGGWLNDTPARTVAHGWERVKQDRIYRNARTVLITLALVQSGIPRSCAVKAGRRMRRQGANVSALFGGSI